MPLSDYLINTLKEDSDLSTREGRSRLLDRAVPYLSKLPQGALRQMVLRDIAGVARVPVEDIEPLLQGKKPPARRTPAPRRRPAGRANTLIGHIIARLLYQPELVKLFDEPAQLDESPEAGAPFLKELVEFIQARPHIRFAGILEHWRGTRFEARLTDLAIAGTDLLSEPELDGSLDTELLDGLERLQERKRKHIRKKLTTVNRVSDLSDEERAELRAHIRRQNLTSEE